MKMKKAFSLIELSVVILIIGILIAGVTQSSRLISEFKLTSGRAKTQSSPVNSIKGLSMWLETTSVQSFADSETENEATVSSWNDIGLQSYKTNATQTSSTNRPAYIRDCINGLPCLRFNGTSAYLNFEPTFLVNSSYTIIVVEQRRSDGGGNESYFIGGSNEAGNGLLHLGYRTNTQLTFAQYMNDFNVTIEGYSLPTPRIHTYTLGQGIGRNYYVNGATLLTNSNSTLLSSYNSATIGRYGNFPPHYFNGDLMEIIMFNRALNTEERTSIEEYLSKKWNIII